jgi:hypothetical protein
MEEKRERERERGKSNTTALVYLFSPGIAPPNFSPLPYLVSALQEQDSFQKVVFLGPENYKN